jgi:hypothetical protein
MRVAEADDLEGASEEAIRALVGAAVKLYAKACLRAGGEISPVDGDVATTEAVVLACALARAHGLTPFDLALWFSHTAPRRDVAGAPAASSAGAAAEALRV